MVIHCNGIGSSNRVHVSNERDAWLVGGLRRINEEKNLLVIRQIKNEIVARRVLMRDLIGNQERPHEQQSFVSSRFGLGLKNELIAPLQ